MQYKLRNEILSRITSFACNAQSTYRRRADDRRIPQLCDDLIAAIASTPLTDGVHAWTTAIKHIKNIHRRLPITSAVQIPENTLGGRILTHEPMPQHGVSQAPSSSAATIR